MDRKNGGDNGGSTLAMGAEPNVNALRVISFGERLFVKLKLIFSQN